MRFVEKVRLLVTILCLLASASPASAQPAYLGNELLINEYTTGAQNNPSAAAVPDGGFIMTWETFGSDGDNGGIAARRFNADGTAAGSEFTVNTYVVLRQGAPQVSTADDGSFVVVWEGEIQDGSGYGIFGQRYDANGVTVGTEFPVNTYITSDQRNPDVSMTGDGNFVVVWASQGQDGSGSSVIARLFGNDGLPASDEFTVNTYTSLGQYTPRVDTAADGSFVVVWASYDGRDGAGYGVFGQRFSPAGLPSGTEFAINQFTLGDQRRPAVAVTPTGFMVVWDSDGNDGSNLGIAGRLYDSTGLPVGDEFVVNTYDYDNQYRADIAADSNGGFVIAWDSIGLDGDGTAVISQQFDAAGVVTGPELVINTSVIGDQSAPTIAASASGKYVIAWTDELKDSSASAVVAQRMLDTAPECGKATDQPLLVVGADLSGGAALVTATDALAILNASVGVGECPLCLCDTSGNFFVTATDALITLNAAVQLPANLMCPNVCI